MFIILFWHIMREIMFEHQMGKSSADAPGPASAAPSERVSPRWEDPRTVAGFASGSPNQQLLDFARTFLREGHALQCLDLGCGAARNALPLSRMGFSVTGTDLSEPMLDAARERMKRELPTRVAQFVHAPMAPLPFEDQSFDLIVAHGIWNLARSDAEFRAAVAEAGRVARPGAGLFLFTFSRHTLPDNVRPDPGETFVFSSWNGEPHCFLTEDELISELARAGFTPIETPLSEYNRPVGSKLGIGGPPVIYEGQFVRA